MILYILIGFLSGIVTGMGIGGGTILILVLTFIYDIPQQQAQNINLIYFIPTAIMALIFHIKNKNILTNVAFKLSIFGIVGALVGSYLALIINPKLLREYFAYLLLIMGIYEFFFSGKVTNRQKGDNSMNQKEFENIKKEFQDVDTDKKVEMYISIQGLTVDQYKELLYLMPKDAINKLEKALS